jgi:AcrR family transcriptional regulator
MRNKGLEPEQEQEESTRHKLIKAARTLIARNGYPLTSTRMIANEAGVTLSAISFHFGSKENLCRAMLEETAGFIRQAYGPLKDEIDAFIASGVQDREQGLELIDRLVALQIQESFDPSNKLTVLLVQNGASFPEGLSSVLEDAVMTTIEDELTKLIYYVADEKNIRAAHCASRAVNASIVTFVEKPLLTEKIRVGEPQVDMERVARFLQRYLTESIRHEFVKETKPKLKRTKKA